MKLSPRDRMLVVILPGITVFIFYLWAVSMPLSRELKALRDQAGVAVDTAKIKQDTQTALQDADQISDELAAEKKLQTQQAAVFPEQWKDSDRSRTLAEVSRFFEASGVQMENSSLLRDASNNEGAIRELAKTLKDKYGAPEPQLWKFQLSGTYAKISNLLKRLNSSERFIVPVDVNMKIESDSPELSWTVILWI